MENDELLVHDCWYVTVIYAHGHYSHNAYISFDGITYGLVSACYFRTPGDPEPYLMYICSHEDTGHWMLHPEVCYDYESFDRASVVPISHWEEAMEKNPLIFDKSFDQEEDGIFPPVIDFFTYQSGVNWKKFWYDTFSQPTESSHTTSCFNNILIRAGNGERGTGNGQ